MNTKKRDEEYVAHTYGRYDLELVKGKGSLLYDEKGNVYIDMATGIAVNTFGACDEEWLGAVTSQLKTLCHTSNLYYSAPCVELAKKLCMRTGMSRVFFSNSGAEANECAIKAARKYAELSGRKNAKIITLENSFHGRTLATLAATGQDGFHRDFLPLTDGFLYARANDLESVYALADSNDIAAVMFECVQGEGGVLPLEREFVTGLEKFARESLPQ